MPVKFRLKKYVSGGVYHIYNRGIDGRKIFDDDLDFGTFEELLRRYITGEVKQGGGVFKEVGVYERKRVEKSSVRGRVEVIAYCLMPDHFHLLVRQHDQRGIVDLMRRMMTGYVMYYNRRHKRVGQLMESAYRAVLVPAHLVHHVGRMIHRNPMTRVVRRFGLVETTSVSGTTDYKNSSYFLYLGLKDTLWITPVFGNVILEEYRKFVEEENIESDKLVIDLKID